MAQEKKREEPSMRDLETKFDELEGHFQKTSRRLDEIEPRVRNYGRSLTVQKMREFLAERTKLIKEMEAAKRIATAKRQQNEDPARARDELREKKLALMERMGQLKPPQVKRGAIRPE